MSLKVLRAEVVLPISVGWTRTDQTGKRTWEYKYLQLSSSQAHEYERLLTQEGFQRW